MSNDEKLAVHKRLCAVLRHRIRTHHSIYSDKPERKRGEVTPELLCAVKAMRDDGYRPSSMRARLHIGYSTIRIALQMLEELQCQR